MSPPPPLPPQPCLSSHTPPADCIPSVAVTHFPRLCFPLSSSRKRHNPTETLPPVTRTRFQSANTLPVIGQASPISQESLSGKLRYYVGSMCSYSGSQYGIHVHQRRTLVLPVGVAFFFDALASESRQGRPATKDMVGDDPYIVIRQSTLSNVTVNRAEGNGSAAQKMRSQKETSSADISFTSWQLVDCAPP